jgi:hypothetical protein
LDSKKHVLPVSAKTGLNIAQLKNLILLLVFDDDGKGKEVVVEEEEEEERIDLVDSNENISS